jgi:hypothetical protein
VNREKHHVAVKQSLSCASTSRFHSQRENVESNRHDLEKIFGHMQTADFTSKSVFVALVVISSWKKGLWRRYSQENKAFFRKISANYNFHTGSHPKLNGTAQTIIFF